MTMKQKIYNTLVVQRKQKSAAQLATQLKTTEATVRARVSDLREDGYEIYAYSQVNSRGVTKHFYCYG